MDETNCDKKMFKKIYIKTKIRMVLLSLVFIGAINWGSTAVGYNFVELLSKTINTSLLTNYPFDKIIYIIVAFAAIWLASKKTTWLPFLGMSVIPSTLIPLKTPKNTTNNATKKINIKTKPNSKIAYWAALAKGNKTYVVDAYSDYSNSGVVMSDSKGNATLEISEGTGYTVPSGRIIPRHVHYRIIGLTDSMIGKVETIKY